MILVATAALLLGGCAFDLGYGWGTDIDAPVEAVEAPPMVRIAPHPGKYLLVLRDGALATRVAPSDYDCNAEAVTLDLREAFDQSIRRVVAPTVEAYEIGDEMLDPAALRAGGYAGQIVVTADPPVTDLSFERRFWFDRKHFAEISHHASTARIDLSAVIHVQYASGRVVETRIAAERRHRNPDGWQLACANATDALSAVATDGLKGFMREFAGRMVGLGRAGEYWLPSTQDGPVSPLAAILRDRTFDLHSVTGDPRPTVDYFDRNWRFVRLEGRCAKVGRWSVKRDFAGETLCIELPGQAKNCFRVGGTSDLPAYHALTGDDERPLTAAWRARAGNAEDFRLDEDRCFDPLPY